MAKEGGAAIVSRRDNFSTSVINILARRAGGKCSMCKRTTFGPNDDPHKAICIGQAAHIAAAAPDGPRYNPTMTVEERTSAVNGMWLCSNCHLIIDRNPAEYPIEKLNAIKREAEDEAKKEMDGSGTSQKSHPRVYNELTDSVAAGVSAVAILEIRKAKSNLLARHGQTLSADEGDKFLESVSFLNFTCDSYLPVIGVELMAFYQHLAVYSKSAMVQLEIIRKLKEIADVFHHQWANDDVQQIVSVIGVFTASSPRSKVYQSAVALLRELCEHKYTRKTINKIPHEAMAKLKRSRVTTTTRGQEASDETDMGGPPTKKALLDATDEVDQYLAIMCKLAEAKPVDEAIGLESEVLDLGFEPNVL